MSVVIDICFHPSPLVQVLGRMVSVPPVTLSLRITVAQSCSTVPVQIIWYQNDRVEEPGDVVNVCTIAESPSVALGSPTWAV